MKGTDQSGGFPRLGGANCKSGATKLYWPANCSQKTQGFYRHWKMRELFQVREKSGNFENMSKSQGISNESGKTVIHKLKFNQLRIKIFLNFSH